MDLNINRMVASNTTSNNRNVTSNQTANKTDSTGKYIDAVYADSKDQSVSVDDFLQLMITQLKNQDFMNPMDDSQYITQLAQFASMQQMQELAYYSKSNYVMSLVGKEVTAAKLSIGGNVDRVIGPVEKISLANNEYAVYVKGKAYSLDQIMQVHSSNANDSDAKMDPSKYSIVTVNRSDTTVDIEWPVTTANEVLATKLKYTVYYSTTPNFDLLEDVKAGTRFGTAERNELTQETITGLEPQTTYFINVVVKDLEGKEAVYSKATITTDQATDQNGSES